MSTPNPLIPQGTFQSQAARGASNVRIAVATIVAIHVVFFGGLLLQGCKREPKVTADAASESNSATNLTLPPIDTSSLYYSTASNLPNEQGSSATVSQPATGYYTDSTSRTTSVQDTWAATNLPSKAVGAAANARASEAAKEYTIVRGDNFTKIAKAHDTTVSALKAANPDVDPVKIRPGMKIKVPAGSSSSESSAAAPQSARISGESAGSPVDGTIYTVRAGDNLTKIARAHGVTVGQLRAANNLRTSRVNVGQKLKIPAAPGASNHASNSGGALLPRTPRAGTNAAF
jgi:LysM repeat protein